MEAVPNLYTPMPEPVMIASSDGVSLGVYDLGGDGPAMMFVHATGFCAGVWAPVADRVGTGRLAAVDIRGHGRSTAPVSGMDWAGTADDVLAAIDSLGLERPFGVGHSMGGASLVLAEISRPGTFRGMWLYEPIIFPTNLTVTSDDNPLVTGALRRKAAFPSAAEALNRFASKAPFSALDPSSLAAYVEYGFEEQPDGSVKLRCSPEIESQTYEMGSRHGAFDHLHEVACPVVVVRGADDGIGPATLAPIIAAGLPSGVLENHPELGHFGPLEDPASMAGSIRSAVTAAP